MEFVTEQARKRTCAVPSETAIIGVITKVARNSSGEPSRIAVLSSTESAVGEEKAGRVRARFRRGRLAVSSK